MVYNVLVQNMQSIKPGTPWQIPSLYDMCTWFFYVRYTTHMTSTFTFHPKGQQLWLSVLLKCHDWDSNPHSPSHTRWLTVWPFQVIWSCMRVASSSVDSTPVSFCSTSFCSTLVHDIFNFPCLLCQELVSRE